MDSVNDTFEESLYPVRADEFVAELIKVVQSSSSKLLGLWKEIGISSEQLKDRQVAVIRHLTTFTGRMIAEDQRNLLKIKGRIRQLESELTLLSLHLKMDDNGLASIDLKNLALLDREAEVKAVVEHLRVIKERMENDKNVRPENRGLCATLRDLENNSSFMLTGHEIPSEEVIEPLRDDVLKPSKMFRYDQLSRLQYKITNLVKELEVPVEALTEFQKKLLSHLDEIDLSEENLLLAGNWLKQLEEKEFDYKEQIECIKKRLFTLCDLLEIEEADRELILNQNIANNLRTIKTLTKITEQLERQRQVDLKALFHQARNRLMELWDKCLTAQNEQKIFKDIFNDNFTEENLKILKGEITTLEEYFKENENILVLIQKRLHLWTQMIEFEKECEDVTRFHNRGGNLLKEEKKLKAFHNNIPKLEKDIYDLVTSWEKTFGRVFQIKGFPVQDFFNSQWEDYRAKKERVKIQRHQRVSYSNQFKRNLVSNVAETKAAKRARPTAPTLPISRRVVLGEVNNLRSPGQFEECSPNFESFKGKITKQMRSTESGTPSPSIFLAGHVSSKVKSGAVDDNEVLKRRKYTSPRLKNWHRSDSCSTKKSF